MRDLLTTIEPSLWSEISAILFALCFAVLVIWIYLPARKEQYQRFESLPLNKD